MSTFAVDPARRPPLATEPLPTREPAVAGEMEQPVPEREPKDYRWMVFVGAILGLALVKEVFGLIGRLPVIVTAKSVSRTDAAASSAALLGMFARIGARVVGIPTRGI
jgi:hypothetical protein